jgi:hypothetical protein
VFCSSSTATLNVLPLTEITRNDSDITTGCVAYNDKEAYVFFFFYILLMFLDLLFNRLMSPSKTNQPFDTNVPVSDVPGLASGHEPGQAKPK